MRTRKYIDLATREGRNLFYQTPEWAVMRVMVLTEEPWCRECKTELSTEVDHIIDIKDRQDLAMERNNLQGLCKGCHSRKTFNTNKSFQKRKYTVVNRKWNIK